MSEEKFIMNHNQAFVLGLFDTGWGVIRSLNKNGFRVVGFDFDRRMPGFTSNFCKAKLCPNPVHQPKELLGFLIAEKKRLTEPAILFPTSDAFVLFISRFRDELKQYFLFILPPEEVIELIINKKKQYELAEKANIPYPKTFFPQNVDDLAEIKKNLKFPVFIKPVYSYKWQQKFYGIKGFKVNNSEELKSTFTHIHSTGIEIMIQEIIPGSNTNHYKVNVYINENNEILVVFTLRKIRQYPTEFGVGSCVESIYDKELIALGLKFFREINYRGVGSIEFKRDERDGKLKLIELNPRYWQQNYLATVCGVNFPLIQYLDLIGQNPKPQTKFRIGVKWLDPIADFQSSWDYFKRGKLTPWQWFKSIKGTKTIANFAWDDWGPFLKTIEYGWKILKIPVYLIKTLKLEVL